MFRQSEETIQRNLNLHDEFSSYWQEWKDTIIPIIRKYEELFDIDDWGYCLESDLEEEIDFLDEIGIEIEIVAHTNGLVIYKKKGVNQND